MRRHCRPHTSDASLIWVTRLRKRSREMVQDSRSDRLAPVGRRIDDARHHVPQRFRERRHETAGQPSGRGSRAGNDRPCPGDDAAMGLRGRAGKRGPIGSGESRTISASRTRRPGSAPSEPQKARLQAPGPVQRSQPSWSDRRRCSPARRALRVAKLRARLRAA